jgi:hypothetical protein
MRAWRRWRTKGSPQIDKRRAQDDERELILRTMFILSSSARNDDDGR